MAKMRLKTDLPTKICRACKRQFGWRRKWARDWANVRYCSDGCRAQGAGTCQTCVLPPAAPLVSG